MPDTSPPAAGTRASTGAPCAPAFEYTIFILADAETVWHGLIERGLTHRYWGHENVSDWTPGSTWEHVRSDGSGTVDVRGRVLEAEAPTRMVWSWAFAAEAHDPEKCSRVTFELTPLGPDTRLTVRHSELEPGSVMDEGVRQGWPAVCSNLKSILETGQVLREAEWPEPDRFEPEARSHG